VTSGECLRDALHPPQQAAEERRDPVAGRQHPTMIAAPKTMNCMRAESPKMSSISVRNVSAIAAIHVDVALASPPESAAPARTTAAIGARRYERAERRIDGDRAHPRAGSPRPRRERRPPCTRTRRTTGRAAGHPGRSRVRPTAWKRRPGPCSEQRARRGS
jgi:hypothetical protein